jgi:hypothetical protein
MSIISAFNSHLDDFLNDIITVLPNNSDIKSMQFYMSGIRKSKPSLMLTMWKTHITDKYLNEIQNNNIDFFINKDYSEDLNGNSNSEYLLNVINKIRNPLQLLDKKELQSCIKYIQNLTQMSLLYNK